MQKFDYTVESSKSFDEAVASVEAKCKEKGFSVLHIHDVKATLAAKGHDREQLVIIETCNAKYASEALNKDIRIALMLPCPITVYVQDSRTYISTLRPRVLKDFFPDAGIDEIAQAVDRTILNIVDEAK
jgi:uncharacterized protein (DUF302 family)